jgi:hypothetical protein
MAGDWIKMRHDLPDDPSVIRVCAALGKSSATVIGMLHRLWSWADRHTTNGRATGVNAKWVDGYVNQAGFSAAMVDAGWLSFEGEEIVFPHFDRHNGKPAKARADAQLRQRVSRVRHTSVTKSCDKSVTRGEESREEKSNTPTAQGSEAKTANHQQAAFDAFRRLTRLNTVAADAALARYQRDSLENAEPVIGGVVADPWQLIAAACSDAIRTGQTPNSIPGAVNLVRTIVERCIRDGMWPGEFVAPVQATAPVDRAPDLQAIIADAQRKSAIARQIGAVNATE